MVLKSINPVSLAKIWGILYAIIGLIVGAIFAMIAFFASAVGSGLDQDIPPFFGMFFGAGALIMMPIFYGILGFIAGLLGALIYNVIAKTVGGIEIELEEKPVP